MMAMARDSKGKTQKVGLQGWLQLADVVQSKAHSEGHNCLTS